MNEVIKFSYFPMGELNVIANKDIIANSKHITLYSPSWVFDLFHLSLIVDSIKRINRDIKISLYLPYIPYSRQDRVCNDGESLSLKVLADYINSLNFYEVIVVDPHSDTSIALINNCKVVYQYQIIQEWYNTNNFHYDYFIFPDAGALKKCKFVPEKTQAIFGVKERNVSNGKLEFKGLSKSILLDSKILVIDDICDGGATFIQLADFIKKENHCIKIDLDLYVTHGGFTKGLGELSKRYNNIYCTNSLYISINSPKLTVFDILNFKCVKEHLCDDKPTTKSCCNA